MPSGSDPDILLMLRVKAGDRAAFAALYARYAGPLFRFLLRMTGRHGAAEDALQETFLRVWRAAPAYVPSAALATWLFTIARNVWLSALARERGRPLTLADLDAEAPVSRETAGGSPAGAPASPLETAERAEAVRRAVGRLPPGERAVVALSVFEGMRYADVGRVLGIPEGTVKSRVASAVRRLREMLRDS